MILVLTETCDLAVTMAASLGGIEVKGLIIRNGLEDSQKKELIQSSKRTGYIKSTIDGDDCVYIWLEQPLFTLLPPAEYSGYAEAKEKGTMFRPGRLMYKVRDGFTEQEKTLGGFLTNTEKFSQHILCYSSKNALTAFHRLYAKYELSKSEGFYLYEIPEKSSADEIREIFKPKNQPDPRYSKAFLQGRIAREEIFWGISVTMTHAISRVYGKTLPMGIKTMCVLKMAEENLDYEGFLEDFPLFENGLFCDSDELNSIISSLKKANLVKTENNIFSLKEEGRKLLSILSAVPEFTDCMTVTDIEERLSKADPEKGSSDVYRYLRSVTDYGWDKAEEWFNTLTEINVSDITCPKCGESLLESSSYGYKCRCGLFLERVQYGKELTEDVLNFLITNKRTPVYQGKDRKYSALVFTGDGKIGVTQETEMKCPICEDSLKITEDGKKLCCACGFSMTTRIYGHKFSSDELSALFKNRKTERIVFRDTTGATWNGILAIKGKQVITYKLED